MNYRENGIKISNNVKSLIKQWWAAQSYSFFSMYELNYLAFTHIFHITTAA